MTARMPTRYVVRRRPTFARIAAVAILGSLAIAAQAAEADASMFSLRGFGTFGAVHSNQNQADFVGNFFQPNGAGHWRSTAISADSKLGVQLDARFGDKLSGVVQVVSQYRYDGSYTPQLEWANLKYQATPDFDLRLGRFVASTFLMSEANLVGYAHPWVRPPQELYAMLPISNKDGIDAIYRFDLGAALDTVQVSYGRSVKKLAGGGEATADHYLDVHNTLTWDATTFHVGYTSIDADFHTAGIDALFDGLVQFGNTVPGPAGQQALRIEHQRRALNTPYAIVTVGVNHDPGDWLLMAEWARAMTQNPVFAADTTAWYVTGGYRIGAFTPYATVAQVRPKKLITAPIPTAGLTAADAARAAALNGGVAALINGFAFSQDSISAGLRWDFRKDMDLKVQYEHLRTGSGSSGRLINAQPGFRSGDTADVFSVALDFVF